MSQEAPPGDMLFGSVVLAIFLVFVFTFGWLLSKFKNRRFTHAWAPLVPLLQGTVHEDGGGAASSFLSGTYRGHRVRATMAPDQNRYSGESGDRYNYFDVALLDVPGRHDWRVELETAILGFGRDGWKITAGDPALVERLQGAGVLALITRFGQPEVAYQARGKTLLYSEDVTPNWIAMPARFQEGLELLLALARINAEVNPA